jgi:hypothetical protein
MHSNAKNIQTFHKHSDLHLKDRVESLMKIIFREL